MSMPFDRYLSLDTSGSGAPSGSAASSAHPSHGLSAYHGGYDDPASDPAAYGGSTVPFQLPAFMQPGPPALAQGGGAEVLPTALFAGAHAGHGGGGAGNWMNSAGYGSAEYSPTSPTDYANGMQQQQQHYQNSLPSLENFIRQHQTSAPSYGLPGQTASAWDGGMSFAGTSVSVAASSAFGLPVYSASGFDLLSILGRVAHRTHPTIELGPVDLTCAFVVTDVRRYDAPIVYASPTFLALTGYAEPEVLGRNCRFLQAPGGHVVKGEERRYTEGAKVNHLRKALAADKECQTTLVNYRKGGQPFVNLVSVIPVRGGLLDGPDEQDDVVYHVGFQVDLTQQPNAILQRLKDGSYLVNYSRAADPLASARRSALPSADGALAAGSVPSASLAPMAHALRALLAGGALARSIPLSTRANALCGSARTDEYDDTTLLQLLLCEAAPDFLHVLSLKGVFLYVAPAVRRVLGYEPADLLGQSVADICHPADLVPLMRELKESSAPALGGALDAVPTGPQSVATALAPSPAHGPARTVDLLFRARHKAGHFVWLDCRGRLHVEAGKGRKAIIMSGRQRGAARLPAAAVRAPLLAPGEPADGAAAPEDAEFWAALGAQGTLLCAGPAAGVRALLGWSAAEAIGRTVREMIPDGGARAAFGAALAAVSADTDEDDAPRERIVRVTLLGKDGRAAELDCVLFRPGPVARADDAEQQHPRPAKRARTAPDARTRARLARGSEPAPPVIMQARLVSASSASSASAPRWRAESADGGAADDLFAELATARETSWQYELQQLKYANRRLEEEVRALEGGGGAAPAGSSMPYAGEAVAPADALDAMDAPGWERRAGGGVQLKRPWEDDEREDGT